MDYNGGTIEADHLCVLVHGLWGNPNHMSNIAKALRAQYPEEKLYLLLAKRNSGSFTYDGIELGGERVCAEIEEELDAIKSRGGNIKKLSIVGYSLGGLVARYAVGLLCAKGILDTVECMNFTTFATPHLGVRSPLKGWHNHLWNVIGARTLSMSGKQLFTVDKFRDTGKPLLSVLAEPKSIFIEGLKKFKRRTLYSNIVNDRSAVHYTTMISRTDPYTNLDDIEVNYLEGYEEVILDPSNPMRPLFRKKEPVTVSSAAATSVRWAKNTPLALTLMVVLPIGVAAFLVTSVFKNRSSSKRIQLHESGLAGIKTERYRVPLWIRGVREEAEQAYEALNSAQGQEYLGVSDDSETELEPATRKMMARERRMSIPSQPTLALAPDQFSMIHALDSVGWRKYPVWIHKAGHSHAAIIVRMDRESFSEGWTVMKHWLVEEFLA